MGRRSTQDCGNFWEKCSAPIGTTPVRARPIQFAGFHKTLNKFISYHFSNTDLIDQKNRPAKAKKPFKYTVEVLCSRLCHLNKLMSKLTGVNNMLPYNKGALKIELFKMMLSDWQINFNNAGLNIRDDAYTLQCLSWCVS
jgi:hypothetical protein